MQDILPPINGAQRGAIRPQPRSVPEQPRPVQREAVRPTRSIDGMVGERPTVPAPTPVAPPPVVPVAPAPIPQPAAPVQLVSDFKKVSLTPISAPIVSPSVDADVPVEVATIFPGADESVRSSDEATKAEGNSSKPKGKAKKSKKKLDWKKWALIAAAIILLAVTGYIAVDTWFSNAKTTTTPTITGSAEVDGASTVAQEGQDESKITKETLASYKVAADQPRALHINKLNIASRILPMTVNSTGSIKAPLNIYDSGWYTGSVKPGETGAMFIDGHASGPTREGLFAYLDTLVEGDTLQVEKGDGTKLTYKVVHTEVVPLADIDMKKVLLPYGTVSRGLNLMTCTGKWLPKEYTYDHRVVVYTEQV